MVKDQKKYRPKLKQFYIFLTFLLFFSFFFFYSPDKNNLRVQEKINEAKSYLSKVLSPGRLLEEIEKEKKNTTKICEKISDDMKQYYKTGDKEILGIDEDKIEGDKGDHITALINIVKVLTSDKESTLRTLEEKKQFTKEQQTELMQNFVIYGKTIIPLLVLFVIAILSIPGWITCCSCCCCCNCCCCCCCKKDKCKTPCFVLTFFCYGIVALICFYSLGKSNSIFYGVADTECSVLKSVDEVLYGETNQNPPFWGGIEGITDILDKLLGKIDVLKTKTPLNKNDINEKKPPFENALKTAGETINSGCSPSSGQTQDYCYNDGEKIYKLDVAKNFGEVVNFGDIENIKGEPKNSIADLWIKEYKKSTINSDHYMTQTTNSFDIILNQPSVTQSLNNGKDSIKEMEEAFDGIKKKIAGNIYKYADDFDSYGRLGYKLVFTVLILIDAGLAAFMIMLCMCSAIMCNCCSCTRCFCKFFIHILWNLMALCMCALFIFGSLFTLFGAYGKDMTSVLAFLVSEENLGADKDTILLGDVKKYLNKCFNGDGDILREMGFGPEMEAFEALKEAELNMEEIQNEFINKKNMFVYTEYISQINDRKDFKSKDLSLIEKDSTVEPAKIKFIDLLDTVNLRAEEINKNERWDIASNSNYVCTGRDPNSETTEYHPNKCWPTNKDWVIPDSELQGNTKTNGKLIAIKTLVELASGTETNSIKNILENNLKGVYEAFLTAEINTLSAFIERIQILTKVVSKYSGKNEKVFNFANCGFIKTNIQVLIKNLKDAFGNDLYTIGVFFLLAAFSMAIAICSTILLIVIINGNTGNNKKGANEDEIKEMRSSEERVFKKEEQ